MSSILKPAAVVLQHPSAHVTFDPPADTPELDAAAFKQACEISVALDLVDRLVVTFGAARVARWVKNIAAARGETS